MLEHHFIQRVGVKTVYRNWCGAFGICINSSIVNNFKLRSNKNSLIFILAFIILSKKKLNFKLSLKSHNWKFRNNISIFWYLMDFKHLCALKARHFLCELFQKKGRMFALFQQHILPLQIMPRLLLMLPDYTRHIQLLSTL